MIMGYGLIAVPTGIVTVEMAQAFEKNVATQASRNAAPKGTALMRNFANIAGRSCNYINFRQDE